MTPEEAERLIKDAVFALMDKLDEAFPMRGTNGVAEAIDNLINTKLLIAFTGHAEAQHSGETA